MPPIIKGHTSYAPKRTEDVALLPARELTTAEAAELAGCSTENIRLWVIKHRTPKSSHLA
jgi:hypothetical protein